MKNKILRKLLSVLLAAVVLLGTGFTTTSQFVGTSVSVSASETLSYGDLNYYIADDNTITISGYTGKGDLVIPDTIDGKSVTAIGWKAFYNSKTITGVTIPDSVIRIKDYAFKNCTNLKNITISEDSSIYCGDEIFEGTEWLTSQPDGDVYLGKIYCKYKGEMPQDYKLSIKQGTNSIAGGAVQDHTNLKNLIIPDGVEHIGTNAFWGCTNITSVSIPNSMKELGDSSFYGCSKLSSVKLSEGMTAIQYCAFQYCTALSSISIPDSVTTLGVSAFAGCSSLKSITFGKGITQIDAGVFTNCPSLKNVTIPDGIVSIGDSAFAGCTSLINITIPDTVVSIETHAFMNCRSMQSITLPQSIKEMGVSVFTYYSKSTFYTKPTNLTTVYGIGNTYAETYTNNLIGGNADYNWKFVDISSSCNGFKYIIKDSGISVVGYDWDNTSIVIPSEIDGIPVTEIANYAFENTNITKIVLPDSIQNIGICAFKDCSKLTSITLPKSMKTLNTKNRGSQFSGCCELVSVKLPENLEKIPDSAFEDCFGLKSIFISPKVQSIGTGAFDNCSELKIYGEKGSYAETYAKAKGIGFVAVSSLTNKSTVSAESIKLGDSVKVMCAASGGTGSYQYNVLYKQTSQSKWTTAQSYKTNATVSFKPGSATTYDVCVKVKDGNGTEVKKYFTVKVTQAVAELSNTSTLSASFVKLGDTVTVKCSATGGTGTYQYNVLYKQTSQSKWTTAQSYKTNATVSFKPGSATTYDVCVKVKDSSGTEVKKYFTVKVEKAANELGNISTISSTSIKLGETVTVTAKGSGSSGFYLYAVYSKKTSDTKWTTQQNFSSNGKIIFKPEQAGSYDICVKVKDDKGSIAKKYFTVTVSSQSSLTNTSKISADTIKLGNSVTVECSAKGSTGFYQYAVYYKQTSQSKWTTKQNYDPNYTVSVKPNAATTYDICVKVKDNLGNEAKKYFTVTVK